MFLASCLVFVQVDRWALATAQQFSETNRRRTEVRDSFASEQTATHLHAWFRLYDALAQCSSHDMVTIRDSVLGPVRERDLV